MKKYFLVLILVFACSLTYGQYKADFRAAEKYSSENLTKMMGSTSVQPTWLKKSDLFWYSYKTGDGNYWWLVDPAKKAKSPLFDVFYMASKINQMIMKPVNHLDLPIKNLKFKDDNKSFNFEIDSFKFEYKLASKDIIIVDTIEKEKKKDNQWMNYNKDSTWIIFARKHNLYLMKAKDKDSVEYQLTTDGEKYYSWQSDSEDTTTTKRLRASGRWFEDNKKFYVDRDDSRKVKDLWVINTLKDPRPELETYRYAMPGDEFVPQNELWVFDVDSRKGVKIQTEKWKDQTFGIDLIKKRSDALIFIRKDRTCAKIDVCLANTTTGESKVLFSETSEPYFNNEYTNLSVINEGKDLIWWSERTGFGQLYLYDAEGNLKNSITSGNFVVGSVSRIDTLNREIYFEGYDHEPGINPNYALIYKAKLDGTGFQLVTPEDATHTISMPESSKYMVDNFSRVDLAPKSVLRDNKGAILMDLETMDMRRLLETGWQMPERFKVKAVDGVTDLYGELWKPFKMEKDRKYPIISYVYPGPQTESVSIRFTPTGGKNQSLAQLGFVVISVGHRGGSPKRYKYYHTYGYNNLRDYALADDKYALEQLADKYDFIDITKVGIFGHSGGGFMSTAAILTFPDFYKAAVSSSGNHDNNIYNLWWGETHNGVKEVTKTVKKTDKTEKTIEKTDKKEAVEGVEVTDIDEDSYYPADSVKKETVTKYEAKVNKNQDLANNLKGHLMLVTGDIDNNVHPGNTFRVADALIKANKRFDFMIMPGQRHGYGNYTRYFDHAMWYYFAEHLLGDYRDNVELNLPDER
jgi:dipeptidyl aminopeptidase/acylaminoacyl peptidase